MNTLIQITPSGILSSLYLKILLTALIICLILLLVKLYQNHLYTLMVNKVLIGAKPNTTLEFSHTNIFLPEPVKAYLQHVLPPNFAPIASARVWHDGIFKSSLAGKWMKINGEAYYNLARPAFIWQGKTLLFTAIDCLYRGNGKLDVWLLGLIKIVHLSSKELTEAELQRWLGESVWYPTNLLPSKNLRWKAIDDVTAQLIYTYRNKEYFFIVHFNKQHEIVAMETKRFLKGRGMENWKVILHNYQKFNDILIPAKVEAMWCLKEGNQSYAEFNITKVNYAF